MNRFIKFCGIFSVSYLLHACYGEGPVGDLGIDDCESDMAPLVANYWAGAGTTDVTFVSVGDSQVFLDSSLGALDKGYDTAVAAINAFSGFTWSALGASEPIDRIRGLIMAGDITQNGRDGREGSSNEFGVFAREYGLCGNRRLSYPVYEGYGNHDYREWSNLLYPSGAHPVVDAISIRNNHRTDLSNRAANKDGHYTWKWDDVYFINLNLTVSDHAPAYSDKPAGTHDPRNSLAYLKNELARIGTDAPVIITHHYPPTSGLNSESRPDTQGYQQAIQNHNVIGIIHGHIHGIGTPYEFNGVPTFYAGYATRHFEKSSSAQPSGTFRVFRITNEKLYSLAFEWQETSSGVFQYSELPFSSTVVNF